VSGSGVKTIAPREGCRKPREEKRMEFQEAEAGHIWREAERPVARVKYPRKMGRGHETTKKKRRRMSKGQGRTDRDGLRGLSSSFQGKRP